MECEQPSADRERQDRKARHSRYEEERQAEEGRKHSKNRAEREKTDRAEREKTDQLPRASCRLRSSRRPPSQLPFVRGLPQSQPSPPASVFAVASTNRRHWRPFERMGNS